MQSKYPVLSWLLWTLLLPLITFCQPKDNDKNAIVDDFTAFVDPQIGSVHGRWFFYTPAALPFGMAKLAPHTNAYNSAGGWGPTGYDDRHSSIEGFGHFHEFQIGGLVFMPTVGEIKTVPGTLENPEMGYRSGFDKSSENASPGYYEVHLEDYGIHAELTATERVGYHRYTFPKTEQANLIIDIGHKQGESGDVTAAEAKLVDEDEIAGFVETYPEYAKFCDPGKRVRMYFVAKLSKSPKSFGSFINEKQVNGERVTSGIDNGLFLSFDMEENEILEIQTGLSYTSIDNARLNLETESTGQSFDDVRKNAKIKWNEQLSKIKVKGGEQEDILKFYTGLYHVLLGRGISNDVNGQYPKVDNQIGQIPLDQEGNPKYHHINTDGMWGGFWNLSQVWALAYPGYFSEYVQSNIDFYKERGWLHDGEANGVYTNGVQTNFQGLLLASAYHSGIRDFDVETGYEAALKNELEYHGRDLGNGKYDLSYFVKDHYVPYKDTTISNGWVFNFGGSHTMEYSYSSFAVAQMSKALNDQENYEKLMEQAAYYKNLYDKETNFIRPKLETGEFIEDFDAYRGWDGFQEGNAFQYTWYIPHDPAGLIALMGKDLFNQRLENMFEDAKKGEFGGASEEIDSFSGIEQGYNHGNQPSLHNAWLFNYSGQPWRTQKWVREICNGFYGTTPLHGYGVGQDEDQGQLGAWYVLASMGLFDVQGHTALEPTFQLASPLFESIIVELDPEYYAGDQLKIEVNGQGVKNQYIQSASWNGQGVENNWVKRSELMKGGILEFNLGPEPNKEWGVKSLPPSMSDK
ncbi:GH92 family glycosyl hydrolase [Echinicola salinicaeni]|uniref:GH92 family glycosyl hydrolase n=1 Tax=Echinicola salinicaeni TaxID=2762757 RepID=UPI001645180E|nr:GH92 family glycosyl hydrolase [Echinicola salinicaeni]